MVLYDALHSWAKNLQDVKHGQQPLKASLLKF